MIFAKNVGFLIISVIIFILMVYIRKSKIGKKRYHLKILYMLFL